jgi:hypothetical protein
LRPEDPAMLRKRQVRVFFGYRGRSQPVELVVRSPLGISGTRS